MAKFYNGLQFAKVQGLLNQSCGNNSVPLYLNKSLQLPIAIPKIKDSSTLLYNVSGCTLSVIVHCHCTLSLYTVIVHCQLLYAVICCTLSVVAHCPSLNTVRRCTLSVVVHFPSLYTVRRCMYTVNVLQLCTVCRCTLSVVEFCL